MTNKPTSNRRLLKLADLLDANASNKKGMRFDLSIIARSLNAEPAATCGTTGCAIGLAIVSGAFKRAGLTYAPAMSGIGLFRFTPKYSGVCGFGHADAAFFGLAWNEHMQLFSPSSYEGKTDGATAERKVARRIRKFVEERTAA